jgi:ketosteroid isomerase-like protein
MRNYVSIATTLIVTLVFGWNAAYAADSADQQAIMKIEREWGDAFKTLDKSVFEKYLSEDIAMTDENGKFIQGRAAYIDGLMKGPKMVDYTMSDVLITVHGSTAIVTGKFVAKDADGSMDSTRFTDTFMKGPDGWKAIASQETKTQ